MNSTVLLTLFAIAGSGAICHGQDSKEHEPVAVFPDSTIRCEGGPREWCPGEYRGLRMGLATRSAMLRILGQPDSVDVLPDGSMEPVAADAEHWFYYPMEQPGYMVVAVNPRTGAVGEIMLHPERMSRDEVVERWGDDYTITRYDFEACLGDHESAPVYESPHGSFELVEYRAIGIAVALDPPRRFVDTIYILSGPFGSLESECARPPGSASGG